MSNQPTQESFLKDVTEHKMEVLMDQGVYRHVRFSKPSTGCYSFNLITGPGFLLYRGDMGTFEFERLHDMFEFFRADREYDIKRGRLVPINLKYLAEKLESADTDGGYQQFSPDKFRRAVIEDFKYYASDMKRQDRKELKELKEKIRDDVLLYADDEHDAYDAVYGFEFIDSKGKTHRPFQDWEHSCKEYTYHFVWCCYAISWGIMQYDAHKAQKEAA